MAIIATSTASVPKQPRDSVRSVMGADRKRRAAAAEWGYGDAGAIAMSGMKPCSVPVVSLPAHGV
jgi:hypothetical protein